MLFLFCPPTVLECIQHQRFEALTLPEELQSILRCPEDELNVDVVQAAADALRSSCCKEKVVELRLVSEVRALIQDLSQGQGAILQRTHVCSEDQMLKGSRVLQVRCAASTVPKYFSSVRSLIQQLNHAATTLPTSVVLLEDPQATMSRTPLSDFGTEVIRAIQPIMKVVLFNMFGDVV